MKKNKKESNDLFIYGSYTKLINNEKHYIVTQSKYKISASYWLLIIFAGIGVVFSANEQLPLDRLFATSILSIIGLIGSSLVWHEDVINQERFLNLNHLEALLLENKYSWLPQVHHQHLVFSHKKMLKYKNLFYIGCNSILFLILEFTSFLYLMKFHLYISIITTLFFLIIFLLGCKKMFKKIYLNELSNLKAMLYD